jgi:hypothetical protein
MGTNVTPLISTDGLGTPSATRVVAAFTTWVRVAELGWNAPVGRYSAVNWRVPNVIALMRIPAVPLAWTGSVRSSPAGTENRTEPVGIRLPDAAVTLAVRTTR